MIKGFLKFWIPLIFVICCFCGLVSLTVQQSYRQTANDPQMQMAEDGAAALQAGAPLKAVVPSGTIDIARSLAPYLIIYDESGKPLAGDGILDGALPNLPPGVFADAQANGEDWFTWQPQPGVRSAVVIDAIQSPQSGFVLAGRSLREVEIREDHLTIQVLAVFIFAMIGSAFLVAVGIFLRNKEKGRKNT